MHIHPTHTDRANCPYCGPHAPTVADALAAISDERLAAAASRLAYQPLHDVAGRQAVLVEVATGEAVLAWCGHEARELAEELLAGPYQATLCLQTPRRTITVNRDELVALAVALHHVADELHAPRNKHRSVVGGDPWCTPSPAMPNRATRRAQSRRRHRNR